MKPENVGNVPATAPKDVGEKSGLREDLESKVEWTTGTEWLGKPTEPVSIVMLGLPQEKYTDLELEKIVAFAERITAKYDQLLSTRKCANFIQIDKKGDDGTPNAWQRVRISWSPFINTPWYSDTLEEALKIMET